LGLINKILGVSKAAKQIGAAVEGISEVFVPNATKNMLGDQQNFSTSMAQFSSEFQSGNMGNIGWFDRFVNGLNRLPRPCLAIGTLGLFVYAMISPESFSARMQGLALVPQPLWWLLGAIVSFYFGAREMHYTRNPNARNPNAGGANGQMLARKSQPDRLRKVANAALAEWRTQSER